VEGEWRLLRPGERRIIERLVEAVPEGRDRLLHQLANAKVKALDHAGTLAFDISDDYLGGKGLVSLVTGVASDVDGMYMELALFLTGDGRIYELNIWKGDLSPVRRLPEPAAIEIVQMGRLPS